MDDKDHYCGLSLDIASANRKVINATRHNRGDCMDEVDEGSATNPCNLTLYPGGGGYVLMASTEKLSDENGEIADIILSHKYNLATLSGGVRAIVSKLKQCPEEDMVAVLEACGLQRELSTVSSKLLKPKYLTRPIIRIVKNDLDGARRAILDIVDDKISKKRRAEEDAAVDDTGVPEKAVKKVMRTLKSSKKQAVMWLRENELDPDLVNMHVGYRIYEEGFAEDI
jgi:NACalpha-BTF3-like transcription factor